MTSQKLKTVSAAYKGLYGGWRETLTIFTDIVIPETGYGPFSTLTGITTEICSS